MQSLDGIAAEFLRPQRYKPWIDKIPHATKIALELRVWDNAMLPLAVGKVKVRRRGDAPVAAAALGWGLPVGESLWFGKVCITSTTTSMPEVGGAM